MKLEHGRTATRFIWSTTVAMMIVASLMLGATYLSWMPAFTIEKVPCDGVERWYTGNGFRKDVLSMKDDIGYEPNPTTLAPYELVKGTAGDCKTISHSIMCLSRLYNTTCVYYSYMEYDPTMNGTAIIDNQVGHLGIKCREDWGGWSEYN